MTRTIDLKKRRERKTAPRVPLAGSSSPPLPEGNVILAPTGDRFVVSEILKVYGNGTLYRGAQESSGQLVWIRAAIGSAAEDLRREFEALSGIDFPMFYEPMALIESAEVTYSVTEPQDGITLNDALPHLSIRELVSVLAQAAAGLKALHARGWVHNGVHPRSLIVGKPLKLTGFDYVTRIGTTRTCPISIPGYSSPGTHLRGAATPQADIYALGAILYEAAVGARLPETGFETAEWSLSRPLAGVPQILHRCLIHEGEDRYPSMAELHHALVRLAMRMQPTLHFTLAGCSSIGLAETRETNQDGYGFLQSRMVSEGSTLEWAVACVSDGMGGMQGGDLASEAAIGAVLAAAVADDPKPLALNREAHVLATHALALAANKAVCSALEQYGLKGGATLVCTFFIGRQLALAHIGDSRVYLFRDGVATPLTRDHSIAMAQVLEGDLSLEDIRTSSNRNLVTRSLGERNAMPDYMVDTLRQATGADTLQVQAGDTFVMCSDGVWEPVVESAMLEILATHAGDLQAAADALVSLALEHGGSDNATALLIHVSEVEAL